MNNIESIKYFTPELTLVITAVVILLLGMRFGFAHRPEPAEGMGARRLLPLLTLTGLVVSMFFCAKLLDGFQPTYLFSEMIALDRFALFFKIIFLVVTGFIIMFSIPYQSNADKFAAGLQPEYYVLLLISTLGLFCLSAATDLLMMYLAVETVSISSYILTAFLKGNRKSSEAGLKYVIFGAVASGIMIFGLSLIYGLSGSTNFEHIPILLASGSNGLQPVLLAATIMVIVGLGYKIAAVPFHMWCPDVYEGAPTPITAFLSVAPKAAGFAVLIRFFYTVFSFQSGPETWSLTSGIPWPTIFAIICVLTMTLGNLAALWQNNLKRLLAYSSIAHAGYLMMGLVLLTGRGLTAILIYLVIYLFMNLGAFMVVIIFSRAIGSEDIKDYKGLGWRAPLVGVIMCIFLFSLTGLPPLAGFIGKFYLFAAVIEAQWYWLAIVGVLNSVISLFYYARIIKAMFLSGLPDESAPNLSRLSIPGYYTVLLILLVLPVLVLGIYWEPLYNFAAASLEFL
ncbi:MAG: NADH-quinone oxidoreductase subunit N [Planctomycetota bacterium]